MPDEERYHRHDGPVHHMFGLTYAHYLVLPRALLQEMPIDWQDRFRQCVEELHETFDWDGEFMVKLRGENGKFVPDPLSNYRHPDIAFIDGLRRSVKGVRDASAT